MKNFISPNYAHEKLEDPSMDDLIDVFEDRIKHWMLIPAERLLELPHSFIAAMNILFTYFEKYIRDLRKEENISLRKCFKQAVYIKWGLDDEPSIIGITEREFLKNIKSV